ncbi:MAG: phospholipase D-like domain-containing protein [Myxococcota bacterium]
MIQGLLLSGLLSCAPSERDIASTRGGRVDVYFNDPGSRRDQVWYSDAVRIMVDLIDGAQSSIDFAVMGFSHPDVIHAFVRAYDRGVQIEMVGDAGHLHNLGYQTMAAWHVPMRTGNLPHIMHDKFMIVDRRFVFASTANWTPTDLENNSNNFALIDSPAVAADFYDEHQQMWNGVFGHNKVEIRNGRSYEIGDTTVEVWFSPNEDAMGRILELVDAAQERISFTIFAFTKDQVGSAFIRKHEELRDKGRLVEGSREFGVSGVIDQSQLHSNGQYHEVYRLLGAGIPMQLDGNDAGLQPGDYQAGGGRLHSKTMVIDPEGDSPVVISGSFNWSASATQSNDEFLLIFHGPRIAKDFVDYFEYLWRNGRQMGQARVGENGLSQGDIVFNEVHWYGVHENSLDGYDEFIELRNLTDQNIALDMWQIANADDFVVGIPPGSVIPAGGTFAIIDHVLERYVDGAPQDEGAAFLRGDLVLNPFNDDRLARLQLKDTSLELFLKDPDNQIVDVAGDGGPAFAGGPLGGPSDPVFSMQRVDPRGDGALPSNWTASSVTEGGSNVSLDYRNQIRATPGEHTD